VNRIEIRGLSLRYGGHSALDDVSLTLPAGCICGLVGMNGAGKSSLLKALTGFLSPARGQLRLNGEPVGRALRHQAVAYMPQGEAIDRDFPVSVWDVVMMGRYGWMNPLRLPRPADREAVRLALERVELQALSRRPLGALSGGQRRRALLARAIAQGASVLLLDEPFNGVDVRTERLMGELFTAFRQEGRTVLLASHDLAQVRDLCDRVVLLNRRLLAYGPITEVFTPANLELTFGGQPPG
jgi:manganese transport system ATP-binding protein